MFDHSIAPEQRDRTSEYWKNQKAYVARNRKKLNEYQKQWYHRMKDSRREILMLAAAKRRAKLQAIPFELSVADIVIPEVCPVLGIRLQTEKRGRMTGASPSLDRLAPELGYVRGNVRVISQRANGLKSDATLAELEAVVRYMRETT